MAARTSTHPEKVSRNSADLDPKNIPRLQKDGDRRQTYMKDVWLSGKEGKRGELDCPGRNQHQQSKKGKEKERKPREET